MADFDALLEPSPRIRHARGGQPDPDGRYVLYWMQRSQRGQDNLALNHAIALANELKLPVVTVFGLDDAFPGTQRRQKRFVVEALPEIADQLAKRNVTWLLQLGRPNEVVLKLTKQARPALVVGDENPLRFAKRWREHLTDELKVPFHIVDSDVIVPSAHFPKEEYAARTIRPKIHRLLPDYFTPIPNPKAKVAWPEDRRLPKSVPCEDPDDLMDRLKVGGVAEVDDYPGGPKEAQRRLKRFLMQRLDQYAEDRNEPCAYYTSELSAHLHFGHISPHTIALAVRDSGGPQADVDGYLEEMIVRRELAINFVARNPHYDKLASCHDWARTTLQEHANDPREHLYSTEQLEACETHDPLWNAAQKEMMLTGRMHGYMRMYWAKKILEWSPDPETAFDVAIDLNDRFEMDGRDPNGYTGVAWAIGGKHDRAWTERPIFGKIRFMSYQSTRRKFDSDGYIARIDELE